MKLKNLNINMNKKASIGTTLTYFFAFFVIVFIIIIYLFFVFAILGKNFFSGEGQTIDIERSGIDIDEEILFEEFVGFLKSPTESNSNEYSNIEELILYSLDPFIENENLMKELNVDVNNLQDSYSSLNVEEYEEGIGRTDLLISESRKILDKRCDVYNLQVPQGFIWPENYQLGNLENDFEWSDWTVIYIPYKGNIIEVKYRRSDKG